MKFDGIDDIQNQNFQADKLVHNLREYHNFYDEIAETEVHLIKDNTDDIVMFENNAPHTVQISAVKKRSGAAFSQSENNSQKKLLGELSSVSNKIREEDENRSSSEKPQKMVKFNMDTIQKREINRQVNNFEQIEEISEASSNSISRQQSQPNNLEKLSKQIIKQFVFASKKKASKHPSEDTIKKLNDSGVIEHLDSSERNIYISKKKNSIATSHIIKHNVKTKLNDTFLLMEDSL